MSFARRFADWTMRHLTSDKILLVARYGVSGILLFCVDFLVFYILFEVMEFKLYWSQWAARLTGAACGFFLHHRYTFGFQDFFLDKIALKQTVLYVFSFFFVLLISPIVVEFFITTNVFGILISKILSEMILILMTFIITFYIFSTLGNTRNSRRNEKP